MKKMYGWALPMIFSFSLLVSFQIQAQSYLVGSAVNTGGNCVQLTENYVESQAGAVWMDQQLNLNYSFTINASVYFGDNSYSFYDEYCNSTYYDDWGADGMTFAMHQLGCDAIGFDGGGMGYWQIGSPSLAVEFDTWFNGEEGFANDPYDPACYNCTYEYEYEGEYYSEEYSYCVDWGDHVALMANGSVNHASSDNLAGPTLVGQLEDAAWHNVVISWNADTQTFSLTLDGNEVVSYSGDLVGDNFGGNSNVTWGFTGATGGLWNTQAVCVNSVAYPCGNNGNKVTICHNGNTLCVAAASVPAHLAHGDVLGGCAPTCGSGERNLVAAHHELDVYPNPASNELNINLESYFGQPAQVSIFNTLGMLVWEKNFESVETPVLTIGLTSFAEGFHFVTVQSNGEQTTTKVTLQK